LADIAAMYNNANITRNGALRWAYRRRLGNRRIARLNVATVALAWMATRAGGGVTTVP